MASTTNYGWTKPTVGGDADTWGTELNTSLDGIDTTVKAVSDDIATQIAAAASVIPGLISAWPAATVPAGWLECNGSAIDRTINANLFGVIGITYGAGDGTTTFNIPDLRGYFVRGFDNGRGIDTGRTLASSQADDFLAHSHDVPVFSSSSGNSGASLGGGTEFHSSTGAAGGTETRPKNIAMLYIIKT